MTPTDPARRRISPATIALALAAVLFVAAVGIVLLRPGETVAEVGANNSVAAPAAADLEATIASMRERLRADPDNHGGWQMLGMALRDMERFAEAEQAFRRAMELAPDNPDYRAYTAEMLLLQGGRNPPPEAEQLLRRVIELQPDNPQARYYLATLRDMRGDHRGAVDALVEILRSAPADAPWEPQVREAAVTIARTNNIDISGRLPPPRAPSQSTATAAIPGPTSEQLQAASSIPPSQQDGMVRGMVERLEGRLRENPRDAERWIFLMRSRMVLNDPAAASTALRNGLAAFNGDAATQQRLRSAASELGVPSPS